MSNTSSSTFSSDFLKVDIEGVSDLGTYLKNADFKDKIQSVSDEVVKLEDSWFDLIGEEYRNIFTDFLRDAKKIDDCVIQLGDFSTDMSEKYKDALEQSTNKIKEIAK